MTYEEARRLAKIAVDRFNALPVAEQERIRREQAIDWAWGQLACMRKGAQLTRELIGEIYDRREAATITATPEEQGMD